MDRPVSKGGAACRGGTLDEDSLAGRKRPCLGDRELGEAHGDEGRERIARLQTEAGRIDLDDLHTVGDGGRVDGDVVATHR